MNPPGAPAPAPAPVAPSAAPASLPAPPPVAGDKPQGDPKPAAPAGDPKPKAPRELDDWTEERAARSHAALRHREKQIAQREAEVTAKGKAFDAAQAELQKHRDLVARAKDFDEEAIEALGLDYDQWTRRRLTASPEGDRLAKIEKQLAAEVEAKRKAEEEAKAKAKEAEERAQAQQVQAEVGVFVGLVREFAEFADLEAYPDEQIARAAAPLAQQLHAELGRVPRLGEMAERLRETIVAHEEAVAARVAARKTTSAPAAEKAGATAAASATPESPPSTIGNADAALSVTGDRPLTREERRERSLRAAKPWAEATAKPPEPPRRRAALGTERERAPHRRRTRPRVTPGGNGPQGALRAHRIVSTAPRP